MPPIVRVGWAVSSTGGWWAARYSQWRCNYMQVISGLQLHRLWFGCWCVGWFSQLADEPMADSRRLIVPTLAGGGQVGQVASRQAGAGDERLRRMSVIIDSKHDRYPSAENTCILCAGGFEDGQPVVFWNSQLYWHGGCAGSFALRFARDAWQVEHDAADRKYQLTPHTARCPRRDY